MHDDATSPPESPSRRDDALVIRLDRTVVAAQRRGNEVTVADPLVAFTLLLDLERRRRAGETIPAARLEVPGGVDARLAEALARHLPWVEVVPHAPSPLGRPASTAGPPGADETSMAHLVTAAELAMLFGEHRP